MTSIAWTGFKSQDTYISNEELPIVEVDREFFFKAQNQKVFSKEEFNIVRKHNFRLRIKCRETGEQIAISTFGLPYPIFVAI